MSKLLERHKKWCETGKLNTDGLCNEMDSLPKRYKETLEEYFKPTAKEIRQLDKKDESTGYWGSGLHFQDIGKLSNYTERRQNIVLLICAMLDEL